MVENMGITQKLNEKAIRRKLNPKSNGISMQIKSITTSKAL